jgi:hypothetical protein
MVRFCNFVSDEGCRVAINPDYVVAVSVGSPSVTRLRLVQEIIRIRGTLDEVLAKLNGDPPQTPIKDDDDRR